MVLGGMLFTISDRFEYLFGGLRREAIYIFSTALVLGGVSQLLLHYLRATASRTSQSDTSPMLSRNEVLEQQKTVADLQSVLAAVKAQTDIAAQASSVWTDTEREKVVAALGQAIQGTLSNAFVESIENKYGLAIAAEARQSELRSIFRDSKRRLETEIESLTRRSNINLVIGVITTLLAVGLLAYVVLSDKLSSTDIGTVLLHFLPRLSIVIFIETFSYFFLRLYKSGLSDIKYYQNELTNIEARHLALEAVIGDRVSEQASIILTEFAKTDRNNGSPVTDGRGKKSSASIKDIEGLVGKISDLAGKFTS